VGRSLHIISFNIPYPPNYGGVIDVFYKIKMLSQLGVSVHLHCFEYGRQAAPELVSLCASVNYYKREHSLKYYSSLRPYIVQSRQSEDLLDNLVKDDFPILFEGLHTCYYLNAEQLKDRVKTVRMHNVEWDYYRHLGKNERSMFRKFYFYTESIKLKLYEKILSNANHILPISENDFEYLDTKFDRVTYLPAFHPNESVNIKPGTGKYALYHGSLGVNENNQAALFLVNKVFNDLDVPFIIAGSDPSKMLVASVKNNPNIQLRINLPENEMIDLIANAQINVLPSFQQTGIKLKLLNALFNGRFCIANNDMIERTGLENFCIICDSAADIKAGIKEYMSQSFTGEMITKRKEILNTAFSNKINGTKLVQLLFPVNQ